jgi:hypothetical protein
MEAFCTLIERPSSLFTAPLEPSDPSANDARRDGDAVDNASIFKPLALESVI